MIFKFNPKTSMNRYLAESRLQNFDQNNADVLAGYINATTEVMGKYAHKISRNGGTVAVDITDGTNHEPMRLHVHARTGEVKSSIKVKWDTAIKQWHGMVLLDGVETVQHTFNDEEIASYMEMIFIGSDTTIIEADDDSINEALVTFRGRAYPRNGTVLILAGSGGSGKGFVLKKLIGLEGKTFNVDDLKEMTAKMAMSNGQFKAKFKAVTGFAPEDYDEGNPKHVEKMHMFVKSLKLDNRQIEAFVRTTAAMIPAKKPNIIFDVTLKDMKKVYEIGEAVVNMGYDPQNVHIVWILTSYDQTLINNQERSRKVPEEVLHDTSKGVAKTLETLLNETSPYRKYIDGDITVVFNNVGDLELVRGKPTVSGVSGKQITPMYFKRKNDKGHPADAAIIKLKSSGKSPDSISKIEKVIYEKIVSRLPKGVEWK